MTSLMSKTRLNGMYWWIIIWRRCSSLFVYRSNSDLLFFLPSPFFAVCTSLLVRSHVNIYINPDLFFFSFTPGSARRASSVLKWISRSVVVFVQKKLKFSSLSFLLVEINLNDKSTLITWLFELNLINDLYSSFCRLARKFPWRCLWR